MTDRDVVGLLLFIYYHDLHQNLQCVTEVVIYRWTGQFSIMGPPSKYLLSKSDFMTSLHFKKTIKKNNLD